MHALYSVMIMYMYVQWWTCACICLSWIVYCVIYNACECTKCVCPWRLICAHVTYSACPRVCYSLSAWQLSSLCSYNSALQLCVCMYIASPSDQSLSTTRVGYLCRYTLAVHADSAAVRAYWGRKLTSVLKCRKKTEGDRDVSNICKYIATTIVVVGFFFFLKFQGNFLAHKIQSRNSKSIPSGIGRSG